MTRRVGMQARGLHRRCPSPAGLVDETVCGMQVQDFDGYREFVIATLPQLKRLDGKEVRARVPDRPASHSWAIRLELA